MDHNISIVLQMIDKYGLSIVISVILIFGCLKLIKIFVNNNIKALDEAKIERQEITKNFTDATERFNTTLNKHLDDNTQTQERIIVSVDGLAQKCSDGFGDMKINQEAILQNISKKTVKRKTTSKRKTASKKRKS